MTLVIRYVPLLFTPKKTINIPQQSFKHTPKYLPNIPPSTPKNNPEMPPNHQKTQINNTKTSYA